MALVKCATSGGRSTSGIGRDEKLRLCLRAIHRLCSIACNCGGTAPAYTATAAIGSGESSTASARAFAEAACDLVGGVVEREWIGARGTGREGERSKAGLREEGDGEVRASWRWSARGLQSSAENWHCRMHMACAYPPRNAVRAVSVPSENAGENRRTRVTTGRILETTMAG